MGVKIDELPDYGAIDSDKKKKDLWEVSKNSGTSGAPIYASDGSRKVTRDELMDILDIPVKVSSGSTIALLEDDDNWTDNLYTGSAIAGQKTGDWYDNGEIRYNFITATTVGRIPYKYL
jgi:hypothetical protein